MNEDLWVWQIGEYLGGRASPEEGRALEAALASDAHLRRLYVDVVNLEAGLVNSSESRWMAQMLQASEPAVGGGRARGSVWGGMVAGLLLGVSLSASVVWAIGVSRGEARGGAVPVANADFESGEAPMSEGVPRVVGIWGGDFAEFAGARDAVSPASGRRMLRFLRADNRLTPPDSATAVSEVWQVLDVAQFPAPPGRRASVVELAVRFNASEPGSEERVVFGASLFAFAGDAARGPELWNEHRRLALASTSVEDPLDHEVGTWQTLQARLSLPAEARVVLLGLRVGRKGPGAASPVFGSQYADDVRVRVVESVPSDGAPSGGAASGGMGSGARTDGLAPEKLQSF
jgi:hypothetical protein